MKSEIFSEQEVVEILRICKVAQQETTLGAPPADPWLDTFKAVRESASMRWAARRDYEWKLSFGIWTALAALIGIMLSGHLVIKLNGLVVGFAICFAVLIVAAHGFYLTGMIKHNIIDVRRLYWVENSLNSFLIRRPPEDMPSGEGVHDHKIWPKVGYFQIGITALLAIAAVLSICAPR